VRASVSKARCQLFVRNRIQMNFRLCSLPPRLEYELAGSASLTAVTLISLYIKRGKVSITVGVASSVANNITMRMMS